MVSVFLARLGPHPQHPFLLYSFCNCLGGVEPACVSIFSYGQFLSHITIHSPWPIMQFSAIICVLFAGALFSATTSALTAVQSPAATAARVAVPQVRKPASPRTATDVKNSIVNWDTSVNTVNDYLVRLPVMAQR